MIVLERDDVYNDGWWRVSLSFPISLLAVCTYRLYMFANRAAMPQAKKVSFLNRTLHATSLQEPEQHLHLQQQQQQQQAGPLSLSSRLPSLAESRKKKTMTTTTKKALVHSCRPALRAPLTVLPLACPSQTALLLPTTAAVTTDLL